MICHGDELGRTQQGNNNAYCQDNELTWIDWNLDRRADRRCSSSPAKLVALPAARSRRSGAGSSFRAAASAAAVKDVAWLAPDGREMNDEAWNADFVRSLGMLLSGNAIEEVNERGEPIIGDTLLVLLNAHSDEVPFTLPALEPDQQWLRVVDTAIRERRPQRSKQARRYPLQGVRSPSSRSRRRCANGGARSRRTPRRSRPALRVTGPSLLEPACRRSASSARRSRGRPADGRAAERRQPAVAVTRHPRRRSPRASWSRPSGPESTAVASRSNDCRRIGRGRRRHLRRRPRRDRRRCCASAGRRHRAGRARRLASRSAVSAVARSTS